MFSYFFKEYSDCKQKLFYYPENFIIKKTFDMLFTALIKSLLMFLTFILF